MFEHIFACVSSYLDDEEFTTSLVLTSKNNWLRKRRDNILRHKSANKLCCIFEDLKDFILNNDDEIQLSNDIIEEDKIENLKILRDEFLEKTSLKLNHTFSPREKKRYVKSENLMMVEGKPTISDFDCPQTNCMIKTKLDPVYRMKPFQKRLLIRNYPNVAALIY